LLMAARSPDYMRFEQLAVAWTNFSAWLITGGRGLALVATIFLVIDTSRREGWGRSALADFG